MSLRWVAVIGVVAAGMVLGCAGDGGGSDDPDARVDAADDAAPGTDAADELDATVLDATVLDATVLDATVLDATVLDAADGAALFDAASDPDAADGALPIDDAGFDGAVPAVLTMRDAYLKASNTGLGDQCGMVVAIDGDTVVVGAPQESSSATTINGSQTNDDAQNSGAAYVFVRSGGSWVQQAYLKASNAQAGDGFGGRVAISGDTIVVAAADEDSNATTVGGNQGNNSAPSSGAVYVFVRNGTTWSQQAYLKASNGRELAYFGGTVAISANTIVVGALGESSDSRGVNQDQSNQDAYASGAAYVFVRNGTAWSQQAYLKASNTELGDQFGYDVAIDGDIAAIAAINESSSAGGVNGDQANNDAIESGAAYVFVRNGSAWSQQAFLKASRPDYDDSFGSAIAISGTTIVVSATLESSGATGVDGDPDINHSFAGSSGAAYVFARSGSTWSQQAYLKASNAQSSDHFGASVAMDADVIVVGADQEGSGSMGIDGDQLNNDALYSGAAYVFARANGQWTQRNYVKSSDPEVDDYFGASVGVSNGTVVVGARGDDSNAIGTDGDPNDNSVSNSGAAFVYR